MSTAASRPAVRLRAVLPLVAGLLLLAGCASQAPAPAPASPSAQPTVTVPSPRQSSAPPPSEPSGEPAGEAIGLSCEELVDADAVYAFNPSFALLEDWSPAAGSLGARAEGADGVACRWVSESGGATLDVSAARPGDEALAELHAEVDGGQSAPYGEEAYFSVGSDDSGRLVIFADGTWISIVSVYLGEAGEADPIADAALAALGLD